MKEKGRRQPFYPARHSSRLLFLKVTFSRIVYLVPPFFIDFSLIKKAGMPAVKSPYVRVDTKTPLPRVISVTSATTTSSWTYSVWIAAYHRTLSLGTMTSGACCVSYRPVSGGLNLLDQVEHRSISRSRGPSAIHQPLWASESESTCSQSYTCNVRCCWTGRRGLLEGSEVH